MSNSSLSKLAREEAALMAQLAELQTRKDLAIQAKAEKKAERIASGVVAVITAEGKMMTRIPEAGDLAFELTGVSPEGYNTFAVPAGAPAKVSGFLSYPFRLALKSAGYKFDKTSKAWVK